ncbi:hypothetical protein OG205_45360 [Lentzea sp. NBC_00516]|uniref:hypothetical protein n=1 Tax=Lentzea sp. NBC_00516 TaxID=2903582 RepID=UPI002E814419|nr:hypothetical protein [Lentzea sp. NBC_00516]WUD25169.1 hypothetical protein OG205_45360 [Lentzea sp. NBC_00516]
MHNPQALDAPRSAAPASQGAHRTGTPQLIVSAAAHAAPAVARPVAAPVVAPPPPPRPPVTPLPVRHIAPPVPAPRPGRRAAVRQVTALQAVCWQVAVITTAVSIGRPWPVTAAACTGAAVLLAVTTIRIRGRWLHQVLAPSLPYLLRPRRHNLPDDDKASALLGLLLPDATTLTVHTGQSEALAISHTAGLTTLVRPRTTGGGRTGAPPSPVSLLPPTDGGAHRFGIQLVFHSGARFDQHPRYWLTVHASRTVEHPTDAELEPLLRNAVRRVVRSLNRSGTPAEPMPAEAAFATIAALGHVTGGRTEVREDWGFWRTGVVSHACFRLAGWDRLSDHEVHGLLTGLAARTAGVAVTVTVAARSGHLVTAVLRLAAPTESAVEAAAAYLTGPLASSGVRLVRLDGSQMAGVAASLPIGGFPQ